MSQVWRAGPFDQGYAQGEVAGWNAALEKGHNAGVKEGYEKAKTELSAEWQQLGAEWQQLDAEWKKLEAEQRKPARKKQRKPARKKQRKSAIKKQRKSERKKQRKSSSKAYEDGYSKGLKKAMAVVVAELGQAADEVTLFGPQSDGPYSDDESGEDE